MHLKKLILFFLFLPFFSFAQRTETAIDFSPKISRLVFEMDNDLLFNTDSYYTAGVGFSYTNKELKKTLAQLVVRAKKYQTLSFTGFSFEQRIYTPYSITEPDLIENDQPYSAYILISNWYKTSFTKYFKVVR